MTSETRAVTNIFVNLLNTWWWMWAPTCIIFWLFTCLADLAYTVKRGSQYVAQYEKSPILRHVLSVVCWVAIHITIQRQKRPPVMTNDGDDDDIYNNNTQCKYTIRLSKPVLFIPTILITLTIEVCIVLAAPLVVWPHVWNLQLFCLIATICGIAHLSGLVQTRRFLLHGKHQLLENDREK